MNAFVARPESGRAPALMVFQEAFGVNEHIKDICKRFAEQGYIAVAPELFHRTAPAGFTAGYNDFSLVGSHLSAVTTDAASNDVSVVHEWLHGDRQVDKLRIGAIGFCMGGRVAYIANATLPLQAAISFYGGGIAQNLLGMASKEHGPMLFFWGGQDKHILPEHRNSVADAMTKAGKSFINVEISDADHAFFNDQRPSYNANASRQAWALTVSFLATYLKS